ncbi:MAG: S-methyl-5-thioribose-1-phosphate isomerase [Gammaproteobacteria bacterium]|nr:S-methyl-5-thioribose-1-phosphate isomerase [Gammaproteobacteria bacterium]
MAKKAKLSHDTVRPLVWEEGAVKILDQRLLPGAETYLRLRSAEAVIDAIRAMAVRGAPAIGIAAAYGVVLAARETWERHPGNWLEYFNPVLDLLASARPTAVNLRWAVERMRKLASELGGDPVPALLEAARKIHEEDIAANRHMGILGAALIEGGGVLTHCNAGSLATGGYGTALGVIRSAWSAGKLDAVYAGETRPWLQGARLTAWELARDRIPVTVIADSAAGSLMHSGAVRWVIVGADRIAANGDVANKIGTYPLAVLARHHGVRLMVVAPLSTIDLKTDIGAAIPIENRDADELRRFAGTVTAPPEAAVHNPVFDVTPAALVDVLVTEKGVVERPDRVKISALF